MKAFRTKLDKAVEEYEQNQTEWGSATLAEKEQLIWNLVRVADAKEGHRSLREWLRWRFGGKVGYYEIRSLIHGREWAHPLFEWLDEGLINPSVAREMVNLAEQSAKAHGVPRGEALRAILDSYDGTRTSIRTAVHPAPSRAAASARRAQEVPYDPPITASKDLKARVKKLVTEFANTSVEGRSIDSAALERMLEEFDTSLSRVVQDFLTDLSRLKSSGRKDALEAIGDSKFRNACEVLGIRASFGAKLDARKVTKAYRARASVLQRVVDTACGQGRTAPSAQRELVAVNKAYEVLRTYIKNQTR
jgi:hypothetical protein